jgi:uncharacterized membrane protein
MKTQFSSRFFIVLVLVLVSVVVVVVVVVVVLVLLDSMAELSGFDRVGAIAKQKQAWGDHSLQAYNV